MTRLKATDLLGSPIRAADGDAGTVSDILFDDQSLAVRWVVVRTGSWLSKEQVLVMPQNLSRSKTLPRIWETRLTANDFRKARPLEDDLPVSLQRLCKAKVGSGVSPFRIAPLGMQPVVRLQSVQVGDQHLRSACHVTGYDILVDSVKVGQVADFIIALPEWTISALVSHGDDQGTKAQDLEKPLRIDVDRRVFDLLKVTNKASPSLDQSGSESARAGRRPLGH